MGEVLQEPRAPSDAAFGSASGFRRLTTPGPLLPSLPGSAGADGPTEPFVCNDDFFAAEEFYADRQSTHPQGPHVQAREDEDARAPGGAAAAWRLHARLDDDAQEAELGAAQDRARAPDERHRGRHLHSGRGPQPA